VPDLSAPLRRILKGWDRSTPAGSESPLLVLLRALGVELGEAERRIDGALEGGKLPEVLIRTKLWQRSRGRLRTAAGLGPLCTDLEGAYSEIERITSLGPTRMWVAYAVRPGDRVEDAVRSIRHALDALDDAIERLAGPQKGGAL
jgi:hypothetical protein